MSELFFTIKTKNATAVNDVLQKHDSVEFDGLNVLSDYLEIGQIVFIVFGGDKPEWETGLVGLGTIAKLPYDYEGRNFKVAVNVKLLFSKPIKRGDLVLFPETYDIIGIAPITKWEPNQALSQVENRKAYALLNAIFSIDNIAKNEFKNLFSQEQMNKITGKFQRYVVDDSYKSKTYRFNIYTPIQNDFNAFQSTDSKSYIRSLLSKPFVILSGNSGTGKTRIAKRFAKYLEKKTESGIKNHLLIPVGADWTDNTKILGYFNPLANDGKGEYVKLEILEFIETASDNPEVPFFLILDEMNLSHVERYFSDFLSAMESGEPILLYKRPEGCECTTPEKITLPKNLFITGTVNIDETTYMFSPKVLDRANVIEFKPEMDDVLKNLLSDASGGEQKSAEDGVAEGFMKLANEVRSGTIPSEVQPILEGIKPILEAFYKELEKCGFEFAYRTVKEIRLYVVAVYKTAVGEKELSDDERKKMATEIADIQILQKILPKIHGNKKQIGNLLDELEKLCINKGSIDSSVTPPITGTGYNLSDSLAKIRQMKDKLDRFQYASFI